MMGEPEIPASSLEQHIIFFSHFSIEAHRRLKIYSSEAFLTCLSREESRRRGQKKQTQPAQTHEKSRVDRSSFQRENSSHNK